MLTQQLAIMLGWLYGKQSISMILCFFQICIYSFSSFSWLDLMCKLIWSGSYQIQIRRRVCVSIVLDRLANGKRPDTIAATCILVECLWVCVCMFVESVPLSILANVVIVWMYEFINFLRNVPTHNVYECVCDAFNIPILYDWVYYFNWNVSIWQNR